MADQPMGRVPLNVDVDVQIKARFDERRGKTTQRELVGKLLDLWARGELKHPDLPDPQRRSTDET